MSFPFRNHTLSVNSRRNIETRALLVHFNVFPQTLAVPASAGRVVVAETAIQVYNPLPENCLCFVFLDPFWSSFGDFKVPNGYQRELNSAL